jgi:hypothetical protein
VAVAEHVAYQSRTFSSLTCVPHLISTSNINREG